MNSVFMASVRRRSLLAGSRWLALFLLGTSACSEDPALLEPAVQAEGQVSVAIHVSNPDQDPGASGERSPRSNARGKGSPGPGVIGGIGEAAPGILSDFTHLDVVAIRIDIFNASTNQPVHLNFYLSQVPGGWTGTLPLLPSGVELSFVAHALRGSGEEIFTGQTNTMLTSSGQNVNIQLESVDDGEHVTLPRIESITLPAQIDAGAMASVTFVLGGNAGEQLTWSLTPASGGGQFTPQLGAISMAASTVSLVTVYQAPMASGTFAHQMDVTNSGGNWVRTWFNTVVGVSDNTVVVQISPVINDLLASRAQGTSSVVWNADVSDDKPASELQYDWSFTPDGTFDPEPAFAEASANPAILQSYTDDVSGELNLTVTDGSGGTTMVLLDLPAGQFPDDPIQNGGGAPPISEISGGWHHTCAIGPAGAVRCFGYAGEGQLGYGNTAIIGDNELPSTAGDVLLLGKAEQVVSGERHTCARLEGGSVRCWGYNAYGQLGHGNTANVGDNELPSSVEPVNVGSPVLELAAGKLHTCARLAGGNVRCWGLNSSGELGYGNTSSIGDNELPSAAGVVSLGGAATGIAASGHHTCAVLTGGAVRCWGNNAYGQLGYGHTGNIGDNETPASAGNVSLGGAAVQIAAGNWHTCALLTTGAVKCWGYNHYGALGYGNAIPNNDFIGDNELPSTLGSVNLGGAAVQIATNVHHTCALLATGAVKCWGFNGSGELGYGHVNPLNAPPAAAVSLGASAFRIALGSDHTCALLVTGQARCWGYNGNGQLGRGNTTTIGDNELPSSVSPLAPWAP